jgi:hypothetical protein
VDYTLLCALNFNSEMSRMQVVRKLPILAMAFAFCFWLSAPLDAQQAITLDGQITNALARMHSKIRDAQNAALDDMLEVAEDNRLSPDPNTLAAFFARHPEQADRVKLGLINLLDSFNGNDKTVRVEARSSDKQPDRQQPDSVEGEHQILAMDLVASLDDDRGIPALIGALGTGDIARQHVLQFGQRALGPVLSAMRSSPDDFVRSGSVEVAVTILQGETDSEPQAQILEVLRFAIVNRRFSVRDTALYEIDHLLGDKQLAPALREFVPRLQNMAQQDPFVLQERGGRNRYPLRHKAKSLLEKLTR